MATESQARAELTAAGGETFARQWTRVYVFLSEGPEHPVAKFSEFEADPEMQLAASNTVGAYLRVAYWLGVALRVAYHQRAAAVAAGNQAARLPTTRITKLELAAVIMLANAAAAAGANATYYLTGWVYDLVQRAALGDNAAVRSSARADIVRVYDQGVALAAAAGTHGARKELQRLAGLKPRVDRSGPPGLDTDGDGRPDLPWWMWAAGALTITGFAAFVAAPYVQLAANVSKR